jgi:hypothetical protein
MLRTPPVGGWWLVVRGWLVVVGASSLMAMAAPPAHGQTPQPFPRQGAQPTQAPRAPATPPAPAPTTPGAAVPAAPAPSGPPTAATLGFPLYPSAQFLASYDAGRGQRYYIFGTTAPFADIVLYYKTQLREGGDTVFREPPTHMFEVGRFREETMAFPPGVTVKDWTWGGSQGYPNPTLGAQPARFPTIIMIVPAPPATPAAR